MPTPTEIAGTIGWLRKHQAYNRDVIMLYDYIEQLQAALNTIRRHGGQPPFEGLLHGDWEAVQELQTAKAHKDLSPPPVAPG